RRSARAEPARRADSTCCRSPRGARRARAMFSSTGSSSRFLPLRRGSRRCGPSWIENRQWGTSALAPRASPPTSAALERTVVRIAGDDHNLPEERAEAELLNVRAGWLKIARLDALEPALGGSPLGRNAL